MGVNITDRLFVSHLGQASIVKYNLMDFEGCQTLILVFRQNNCHLFG